MNIMNLPQRWTGLENSVSIVEKMDKSGEKHVEITSCLVECKWKKQSTAPHLGVAISLEREQGPSGLLEYRLGTSCWWGVAGWDRCELRDKVGPVTTHMIMASCSRAELWRSDCGVFELRRLFICQCRRKDRHAVPCVCVCVYVYCSAVFSMRLIYRRAWRRCCGEMLCTDPTGREGFITGSSIYSGEITLPQG